MLEEAATFWLEGMNFLRCQRHNLIRAQAIKDQVHSNAVPLTSYGLIIGQQHFQVPMHAELVQLAHSQAQDFALGRRACFVSMPQMMQDRQVTL